MATSDQLYLHEEVMLLVLRDVEGTVEFGANYRHALGGALLAELLLGQRIRAADSGKKKVAQLISPDPIGEPVLDECLEAIADSKKPKTLQHWVSTFANLKNLKHRVAEGLCRRGILRASEDSVLLIFSRKIYPEIDPGPEQQILRRLEDAVLTDAPEVEPRTAILLSLARGAGLLKFVFDKKQIKARDARLESIVNGELTGRATSEAIEAAQAALLVTVFIPIMVTSAVHH
ncbi:MAG: GOLPH3/VPS74 family protein [Planctomycetota bacterium]|jgi:nitroreductase